jgi:hypothetical protein
MHVSGNHSRQEIDTSTRHGEEDVSYGMLHGCIVLFGKKKKEPETSICRAHLSSCCVPLNRTETKCDVE